MRDTWLWAFKRRFLYLGTFTVLLILVSVHIYLRFFYVPPNCFDNRQNGDETGVDCGGGCVRICTADVIMPNIKWARSFEVTSGQYNAVAYVENQNREAATPNLKYNFSLYDEAGLILEKSGETFLPPNGVYPIFEGRLFTGGRVPTRTFLEIDSPDLWLPASSGREQFRVNSRDLKGADAKPILEATVFNNSLEEAKKVDVVATIFNADGLALASSRTFVDNFAPRSETPVVFTWLEPIATTVKTCEIPTDVVLEIDISGSMNNDGDNPPQPLTAVKEAATRFVNRLKDKDQVGLVSFASQSSLRSGLSVDFVNAVEAINDLQITKAEEVGTTNTGSGLFTAGEELVSSRHNQDARKVLIILTDGLATAPDPDPEGYALEQASLVKDLGIEVYSIGLGESVNMAFIKQLASQSNNAYQALTSLEVDRIYQEITSSLCEEGPAVIDIIPKTDAGFKNLQ